ncbi:HET-domain-containing protein, partial [Polyplosphaeria fusca]
MFRKRESISSVVDLPTIGYPSYTGHPAVTKTAAGWLTRCLDTHKACKKVAQDGSTIDSGWRPKRLLHINGDQLRLFLSKDHRDVGQYAALSHCWGQNPSFLVLTSDNEEHWKLDLPLDSLPQSFVDAVEVSRRLSLEYLWIDSLCIMQSGPGSAEDWLEHVIDMALVYSNCTVNISADCASN